MSWLILGAFIGTLLLMGVVLRFRPGLPHWSYYGRMPWRVLPEPRRRNPKSSAIESLAEPRSSASARSGDSGSGRIEEEEPL